MIWKPISYKDYIIINQLKYDLKTEPEHNPIPTVLCRMWFAFRFILSLA